MIHVKYVRRDEGGNLVSAGDKGTSTYTLGGRIEVADADSNAREQCARGLHTLSSLLPDDLKNVVFGPEAIEVEVCEEDVIYRPAGGDGKWRSKAATPLRLIRHEEWRELVVGELVGRLADSHSEVRAAAARALGQIGDAAAVPALLKALKDETAWVRAAAARALGQIGDAAAVPALEKALKDESGWVREEAVRALGQIGDAAGQIEEVSP